MRSIDYSTTIFLRAAISAICRATRRIGISLRWVGQNYGMRGFLGRCNVLFELFPLLEAAAERSRLHDMRRYAPPHQYFRRLLKPHFRTQ